MSKGTKLAKKNNLLTLEELKKSGVAVYALIYCRVSSDRQAREGHGLESQEQRCREYAESNGIAVDRVFTDTASGGGDYTSRQGQVELLDYADKNPNKIFVTVVDETSRIARDVQGHFQFRLMLKERGIGMLSPNFNFDETEEGELVEGMMAAVNQYHRKGNRRQVIQKHTARFMKGCWPFPAPRPFEMREHPEYGNILTQVHPDVEYVKEALENFANGVFIHQVDACRFLVDKGYWKGKPEKHSDAFRELAKSVLNVGDIEYKEWGLARREGKHKGFISQEIYDKLQKRLKREGLGTRIRMDIRPDLPMRGLVVCDCCHNPFRGAPSKGRSKKYLYYVCQTKGCKYYGKSVRQEIVENGFKKILKQNRLKDEVGKLVDVVFDRSWKEEVLTAKTQEAILVSHKFALERKAEQLSEAIFDTKSPALKKVYETQLEKIAKDLDNPDFVDASEIDFSIPYRTALDKSKAVLKNPITIWDLLDVREQHRLFYFIFDEKLPYDLENGYRTADLPTAVRLFEEFVAPNSTDVDHTGFEPVASSMPWKRSTN